jgi:hypothetical protein
VPLRLPWTQLVQERLPAGAAEDKRLVDAIDGRSSVTEIAVHARVTERGRVRTLFERLWWYDQVAFDASNARPEPP